MTDNRAALIETARAAREQAYAPYSRFHVGAALRFEDGAVITGCNVENASYGLSLCAETNAVAKAMGEGRRGGLVEVAIITSGEPAAPCGRCRQVLHELASLGGTDPLVLSAGDAEIREARLSELLPGAFGPADLGL